VLVAALEVDVRRPGHVRPAAEHGRVRRAGIEPHVEYVGLLAERGALAFGTAEAGRQQLAGRVLVPGVRALALEDGGDVPAQVGAQPRGPATLAVERRDRDAPEPLARDAPVGPCRDHVPD